MKQDALISVIVPIYNVEQYLPKCVDSILCQTYRNLEVILVDDGSPDRAGEICDAYAEQDSRVRVIHKRNGGLSSARNAGIDIARGDYLSFVDSDDWIEPDTYEAMLAAMERWQVSLVCAGRYDVDGTSGSRSVGLCPEKDELVTGTELVRRIFRWDHLDSAAWDKLYSRELFREIRYPVGRIVEDVPTTYRVALKAGKAALLSKPIYNYLHRENSITTAVKVSEKTFHCVQNAAMVHADIRENYPELEPDARYLWLNSAIFVLIVLEMADQEDRERFAEQYQQLKSDLQSNLRFVLASPLFSRQQKRSGILLCMGLYPAWEKLFFAARRVYHGLRK